jgi:hypothetical protein
MSGDRSTEYIVSEAVVMSVAPGTVLIPSLYTNPDPVRLDNIFVTSIDIKFLGTVAGLNVVNIRRNGVVIASASAYLLAGTTVDAFQLSGINWRINVTGGIVLDLTNAVNIANFVRFNWTYYVAR